MGYRLAALALLVWGSAAWAGQGWYLMVPPLGNLADPQRIERLERVDRMPKSPERDQLREMIMSDAVAIDRPLREWDQSGAFDSAMACETMHMDVIQRAKSQFSERPLVRLQLERARCIASDDPRLK